MAADRLTGMEVFVKAARLGSISAAARAMHVSPAMAVKHSTRWRPALG